MSKYRGLRMPRRHGYGRVAVIDSGLMYASIRRAKIVFWLAFVAVGGVTKVTAATLTTPARSWLLGLAAGLLAGITAATLAVAWPAIRLIWHWLPELAATSGLLWTYSALTAALHPLAALGILAVVLGAPFAHPRPRRWLLAAGWCLIARHRLRVCFAEFLHAGQTDGRLPLILWARPTPAGERVWLWLRPGLAFTDLEGHYDKIAVATWATDVRAVCSTRWAALLRVDITRRNTLTAVVDSPLTDLVPAIERHRPRAATLPPLPVPTGLDLPEIPEIPRRTTASPLPTRPATRAANRSTPAAPLPPAVGPDDHTDWI